MLFAMKGKAEEEWREVATRAACLLLVKQGRSSQKSAVLLNAALPCDARRFRTDHEVWRVTGGYKVLGKRLKAGGVLPAGSLGEWTPDFLSGLRESGGLQKTAHQSYWFTAPLKWRPALRSALEGELPFSCRTNPDGDRLSLYGSWAFSLGADNPEGIGVLAGLLAGGRYMRHEGKCWLAVIGHEASTVILESYDIPFIRVKNGVPVDGHLLVSPFWGALLGWEMPGVFRQWFANWKGWKGMCPLLPWAFLRGAWGGKVYDLDFKAVPFLVERTGLLDRHGIGIGQVREEGFRRLGFSRVDPRLRVAWLKYMKLEGVKLSDFPRGKIPLDFEGVLCHDDVTKGTS